MTVMTRPADRRSMKEYDAFAAAANRVFEACTSGLFTADNIDDDSRWAVAEVMRKMPIFDELQRNGWAKLTGFATLVEGQDWCWATTANGQFGVFSLDMPSRVFLEGATLHLWITDGVDESTPIARVDFTDIGKYQEVALEHMLR